MITLEHIDKKFGKFQALQDIQLTCKRGQCIALIGPNGSGKTTLIKTILQMVMPDKGNIIFKGEKVNNQWEYRSKIGFMPQMTRYPENMKIGELIEMMKDIRNMSTNLDEELINAFNLSSMFEKKMGTLSGGTKQKVGACLAFLFQPDLLILDEPTAGLDPLSSEKLLKKVAKEKAKGKTIIISSHILSDLDELVDDVIYMQDGKILFHTKIDELIFETSETKLTKIISRKMGSVHV
ncbi:ABC transporter ATP-binding protein [Sandaracinomonas limnophila]|uniref:ABC transporter ATP-binding protein n=1 Tax=Sandaracinomonas limnophila TaxID=1862386 RepID=A0A437PMX7_9BACT|nr:ABC transporter ATP-binding protein [Sandaracinomonas limnophila]RVU23615.1 ABC transporter ATP-binding protein [Sandaracinomonas limnophila]